MKTIKDSLVEHPFFKGLNEEDLDFIAGCGKNQVFQSGEMIFREGRDANSFYIIRQGSVSLEIHSPQRGPLIIATVGEGEVLGWSWLVPPFVWHFDARARDLTRTIAMDAKCLRAKCEKDPRLGFELSKRFSQITVDRLNATRIQLLDLYGVPS